MAQLNGTEYQGPHPGATSTIQYSNVRPDRILPAPQSIQPISVNPPVNTKHPIEDFSDSVRKRCIVSIHSNEVLVSMIKNINNNLQFERWHGCYRTGWIGACFRIFISEKGAKK
ncbi:hypothetical protein QBC40DRAFT_322871, partial [Triangularia verruculosa]